MDPGRSRVSFAATVLGVFGEPPAIHWRKLGGSEEAGWRPLGGATFITDAEVLEIARLIPCGAEASLSVVTELGKPGMPSHLEAVEVVQEWERFQDGQV